MSAAIRTSALAKSYGENQALVDVDLVVEEGSVFGFLGPNGAGKTTTLHLLTGLTRPTGGAVQLLGRDVAPAGNSVRAEIGFLPDVPGFYEWMKAEQFSISPEGSSVSVVRCSMSESGSCSTSLGSPM